jgi:hypothetical protein
LSPAAFVREREGERAVARIQIKVENGTVKDIRGIPRDYAIEILDYDVEKYDASELTEGDNHKSCRIVEWQSEKQSAGQQRDSLLN